MIINRVRGILILTYLKKHGYKWRGVLAQKEEDWKITSICTNCGLDNKLKTLTYCLGFRLQLKTEEHRSGYRCSSLVCFTGGDNDELRHILKETGLTFAKYAPEE